MIKKVYVENFKSFDKPTIADLSQLTIIAGANSCGKSSLIQILLLLSQTLENPRSEISLDLGGRYIQFSEFREAVFERPKNNEASFSVGFDVDLEELDIRNIQTFVLQSASRLTRARYLNQNENLSQVVNQGKVRFDFRVSQSGRPFISRFLYKKDIIGVGEYKCELLRQKKNYKIDYQFTPYTKKRDGDAELVKKSIDNILEYIASSYTNTSNKKRRLEINKLLQDNSTSHFDEIFRSLSTEFLRSSNVSKTPRLFLELASEFENIQQAIFTTPVNRSTTIQTQFEHFLFYPIRFPTLDIQENYFYEKLNEQFRGIDSETKKFLRNIHYVGPLRAKPERAYLSTGTPIEIGNSGENAIPILWANQNEKVFNKTKIGGNSKEQKLSVAVQSWLNEFGIATSFHITKPKRVIYQAEMESNSGSKLMVTIADVGFGVSQLLPVIVAGLQSRKGATIILEQPEIHLHPRLQAKLADFLICMAELGKNIIVETHSEHLINMIRLRIIEDKTGVLQEQIGILFSELHRTCAMLHEIMDYRVPQISDKEFSN